jgi:outer membrane protein assembly factor BamA
VTKNAGVTSGYGMLFTYEGRDNRLNPFKGAYFNFELEFFQDWLGSNFAYTRMYIDIRKYVSVIKDGKLVLAGQVLGEFVTDGANIQGLPALGGPDWGARGIYFGRFRDQSSLAGNIEARFPLFWIFGGTVFGGMGQVQPNLAQFKWEKNHYVYGLGLRVMVSSKNRVNLRFDLGFSKDNVAFIVDFAEAF